MELLSNLWETHTRRCAHYGFLWVAVALFVLALTACGPTREEQRQALADELGVELASYRYLTVFPFEYLEENLEKGAPIDEVHSVVRGYERVVQGHEGGTAEVYYFYTSDDDTAVRIEVGYDHDLKLRSLMSEDEDSGGIYIGGCTEGRIGEPSELSVNGHNTD